MNTSETYPYAYTTLRAQISINNLHPSAVVTLGNHGSPILFYNRSVLSAVNKPENAVDVFFNHSLKYGVKFNFGKEQYFINKGVVASRSLDVLMCVKDGVIHYNTECEFKRGLKSVFDAILSSANNGVKPMMSEHMNLLFWKRLPKYKFKTIAHAKEAYRELSKGFIKENKALFTRV